MLPNFIVIGAAKTGTSTLCEILSRHPDVYMYRAKETHFFSYRFKNGFEWYKALFKPDAKHCAVGEGTPDYTEEPRVRRAAIRISKYLPDVKLIYLVRHPLKRMESHYVQLLDNGLDVGSFSEAVRNGGRILESSKYFNILSIYKEYHRKENILVIFLEDLINNKEQCIKDVLYFIGADPSKSFDWDVRPQNTRGEKRTDRWPMHTLRRQRWYPLVNRMFSRKLKGFIKPVLRRKLVVEVSWTADLLEEVRNRLRDDITQFLASQGKPEDYWSY